MQFCELVLRERAAVAVRKIENKLELDAKLQICPSLCEVRADV